MPMTEELSAKEMLQLNAKLQQKKNKLRLMLKAKGILKRNGKNDFDKYSYFSESQYKQLFTDLLSASGLELRFSELDYTTFAGTEKQSNGRFAKIQFDLIDIETGFFESSAITGEALDKGDKAGYKAYTGALKYYFADTFLVATGDDPEGDAYVEKENRKVMDKRKASAPQLSVLRHNYSEQDIEFILHDYNIERLEDLNVTQASDLIRNLNKKKGE